jgi:hypothetical protein
MQRMYQADAWFLSIKSQDCVIASALVQCEV